MTSVLQPSLTGGEWSPGLYARVDLARYQNSLKKLRNFIVAADGGVVKRNGTYYCASAKTSGDRVRLIPFVFNDDQTYVIELGDRYARFYQNGAQVNALETVTAQHFGTGDSEAQAFQLKDPDGNAVYRPHDVTVYIDAVEQSATARTNLLTAPNAFGNAAWSETGSITENNATAPDSTTTADTLTWSA